ncbi:hypothetical protein [Agrobacterium cavarae]|uniref:hypothetical protein n=1 Tax=Agrobacterium cavarae TaxID=2528239 RepID=UPI003FD0538F
MLYDLFGAQGGVLKRNHSIETIEKNHQSSLFKLLTMTELIGLHVPQLDDSAQTSCLMAHLSPGALSG